MVANIGGLVTRARADGVPVIWIQHSDDGLPLGSAGWQLVPELPRQDGDPLVHKIYGDSFEATDLAEILAGYGSGGSSSPARSPTRASGRRSTAPSSAGTT